MGNSTTDPVHVSLIAFSNPRQAAIIESALPPDRFVKAISFINESVLVNEMKLIRPNIVILQTEKLDRIVLDFISVFQEINTFPIVLFVDEASENDYVIAIEKGINALCVNGLTKERISDVIEMGKAQHTYTMSLKRELTRAQQELDSRKTIERAKGLIMERRQLNEQDAYNLIRRMSMAKGKPMHEVAATILDLSDFLS